jgi:hypothetical protein
MRVELGRNSVRLRGISGSLGGIDISCKIERGSVFISRMLISFRSRLEQGTGS